VWPASALVGCPLVSFDDDDLAIEPPPFGPLQTDWPQYRYDAGDTQYVPDGTCPSEGFSLEWEMRPRIESDPELVTKENLVVVTGDNRLYAFDLEAGERVWTAKQERTDPREWFLGNITPAIDDRHVYGAKTESELAAFDRATGEVVWTVSLPSEFTVSIVADDVVYAPTADGVTVAVDAVDGTERWCSRGRPLVTEDIIAICSGDDLPDESAVTDGKLVRKSQGFATARGINLYGSHNSEQGDRYVRAFEVSGTERSQGLVKQ